MKVTWSIKNQFQIHYKWTFKRDFDLLVLVHFNMLSPNQRDDEQKLLSTSMKGRNLEDELKEITT
jgi:DNA replication protein DnaD